MVALAASGDAVKFEIIAPTSAVVGEAIDVTVRALKNNNQVATEYRGSIIFATDYLGDTLPMPGQSIAFTAEDAGEKKFSKGVVFKKTGKQKIFVSDVSDDVLWEVTVDVQEWGTSSSTSSGTVQDISLITPENNSQIPSDTIMVSGTTRKNSKVSLSLNGKTAGTVVSDDSGLFTKELTGVDQENNILTASLLDASDTAIATSSEVRFTKIVATWSIYGLTISPATSVTAGSNMTLTIEAQAWLSSVSATLDGTVLSAKEWAAGKYVIDTVAPQKEWSYPIDVTATSVTNQDTKKEKMATLTVTATPVLNPTFKEVKTETDLDGKVTFSFKVENAPENLEKFKIMYGTGASALDKEVSTQAAATIKQWDNYIWYIPWLPGGTYTFKIYGQSATGAIDGLVSEPITATIGAKTCTIGNVWDIKISTDSSKSVLTWASIDGAVGYNVYKIDTDGKYILVQKVTEPKYTVFLSKWTVEYEDFAVKALCGESTESLDYSKASQVQTGPVAVAFVVIISGILAGLILRKRYS